MAKRFETFVQDVFLSARITSVAENTHEDSRNPADHLKQYRWKKGAPSPTPGGRPKRTPYADAHKAIAEAFVKDLRITPTDTVAVAIAKAVAREALRGKIQAAKESADRAEGTATQRLRVEGPDGGPLQIEAKTVDELRARISELTTRIKKRAKEK